MRLAIFFAACSSLLSQPLYAQDDPPGCFDEGPEEPSDCPDGFESEPEHVPSECNMLSTAECICLPEAKVIELVSELKTCRESDGDTSAGWWIGAFALVGSILGSILKGLVGI